MPLYWTTLAPSAFSVSFDWTEEWLSFSSSRLLRREPSGLAVILRRAGRVGIFTAVADMSTDEASPGATSVELPAIVPLDGSGHAKRRSAVKI